MIDRQPRPEMEQKVRAALAAPGPNPAFVADLKRQLQSHAAVLEAHARVSSTRPAAGHLALRPLWQHRWVTAALAMALVLALALAVAGPQRVLAQFQRWLNYVPGIGFVDLDGTKVLAAPVAHSQNGVSLQITQVIADASGTTVLFSRQVGTAAAPGTQPIQVIEASHFTAHLRLEDGATLPSIAGRLAQDGGSLQFAPLPASAYRIALVLSLPVDSGGAVASEQWDIPLTLRSATGELAAELYPVAYTPDGTEATANGVTVRAVAAAHSPTETVLRVRVEWEDPWWQFDFFHPHSPELRDEVGHVYGQVSPGIGPISQRVVPAGPPGSPPPAPSGEPVFEADLYFASLSPSAGVLTFTVQEMNFDVPVYQPLTVDLGSDPKVGDYIRLDVDLEVAGLPVRIAGAHLTHLPEERYPNQPWLVFDIAPSPEQDGRRVKCLRLSNYDPVFDTGWSGYSLFTGRMYVSERFIPDRPLPTRPFVVVVETATIAVSGPWSLTWPVPGRGNAQAPVTIEPTAAQQTRQGLTLAVQAMTVTDRVTNLRFDLINPPANVTLVQPMRPLAFGSSREAFSLTDDRGVAYAAASVDWSATSAAAGTVAVGPLEPFARTLTYRADAIELAVRDSAEFAVSLPPDKPVNQPWPIDLRVEIADRTLRLKQAELVEGAGTTLLVLTADDPGAGDEWVTELQVAQVTDPVGRTMSATTEWNDFIAIGPDDPRQDWIGLAFDVADPSSFRPLPGPYQVRLDGIRLAVRGPWVLRWSVDQP